MQHRKKTLFSGNIPVPDSLAFQIGYCADVLLRVENGQSLPAVLAATFSGAPFSASVRGAIQDISYLTQRKLGTARFLVSQLTQKPPHPPLLACLLDCAIALLLPENGKTRYEPFTVVNQTVSACSSIRPIGSAKGLVNAVLRRFLREQDKLLEAVQSDPEATLNYPGWWVDKIRSAHPDSWESILSTGNSTPPLTLRVNRRKTTVENYMELTRSSGLGPVAVGPAAIKLGNPVPVDKIPGFMDGLVSVQDAAAQLAAPLLAPENGMRVLDACAAPGGKSGHLLEMADIDLLALDVDKRRIRMINENLTRLGLSAKTRQGDASTKDWWDGKPFDCILADVPCTASGIIRRHPDIRWLRRESDSNELSALSAKILDNLWEMLKPSGRLLLATCSIWPEESELQAQAFARRTGAIRLESPGQLLPTAAGSNDHDGLFYALFKKT